jgi:hypothetical protein
MAATDAGEKIVFGTVRQVDSEPKSVEVSSVEKGVKCRHDSVPIVTCFGTKDPLRISAAARPTILPRSEKHDNAGLVSLEQLENRSGRLHGRLEDQVLTLDP